LRCAGCPLQGSEGCAGDGPEKADLVLVGEAPGWQEARDGVPFVGASGRLLNATLAEFGVMRHEVYVTNVTQCRPPVGGDGKDTPPSAAAIAACRPRLIDEIRSRNPKIVVALGATAAAALTGAREKLSDIEGSTNWREELGAFVIPTYHPAAVLHGGTGFFDNIYDTLQRAIQLVKGDIPMPKKRIEVDWEFTRDVARACELLAAMDPVQYLSLDTESKAPWAQPRPKMDELVMIQMYDGIKAVAFDMRVLGKSEWFHRALDKLLSRPKRVVIMHNSSYDIQVLRANGFHYQFEVIDTMVLGLGLTERGEQVGLEPLSRRYLNAPLYKDKLTRSGYSYKLGPMSEAQWMALAEYGCEDAYYTRELVPVLMAAVKAEGTTSLCKDLLTPAQLAFSEIEYHGTMIDMDYVEKLEEEWQPLIDAARVELQSYAAEQGFKASDYTSAQVKGAPCPDCVPKPLHTWLEKYDRKEWRARLQYMRNKVTKVQFGDPSCSRCMKRRFVLVKDDTFNPNSAPQRQALALDILKMKQVNGRSTDKDFWAYHSAHPLSKLFAEYNERNHLMNNYVRGIADDVWSDGRIHPDFLLFGTVTGRLSIHNPPMQTIPKWGVADPTKAKLIRKLFRASPGHVIADFDYKNLELFIAWHYSGDENLGRALTEKDFHTNTAAAIFDTPYDQVTGLQRFNSKFVTFGIAYGRQAWSLSQGELYEITGGDERKAQAYIDKLWGEYPQWHEQYEGWKRDALTKGVLETPMGRKRRWRLITPQLRNRIENQAVNFPMQSLASDVCLSALIRLSKILPAMELGHVLFTVHDSLVFEIKEDRIEEAVEVITREMTTPPFETHIKLFVEAEIGPSLGEVEEWKVAA